MLEFAALVNGLYIFYVVSVETFSKALNVLNFIYRRLCPDLNFFQKATEFPCSRLCGENSFETLRKRVEQCVLHSESVSRNRLGITNVRYQKRKD